MIIWIIVDQLQITFGFLTGDFPPKFLNYPNIDKICL